MSSLLLHCGANRVTEAEIRAVETPEPTETWHPIPHDFLIDTVQEHLWAGGLEVQDAEYGLFHNSKSGAFGDRMFAVMTLVGANAVMADWQLTVGLRNSHDKSFSAGFAVGSRVFVCDNLAFSGEVSIARKHTRYIMDDLDRLVAEAMGRMGDMRVHQQQRIGAYRESRLSDMQVHDLLIRSVDAGVMANSYIAKVLEEWREPRHEEFEPRTAWSLFNCYTEVFKATNPLDLSARTTRLHGLLDVAVGVDALEEAEYEIVDEEEAGALAGAPSPN